MLMFNPIRTTRTYPRESSATLVAALILTLPSLAGPEPPPLNLSSQSVSLRAAATFQVTGRVDEVPLTCQWWRGSSPIGTNLNSTAAVLGVDSTFERISGDVAKGGSDMFIGNWVDLNEDGWLDLVVVGGFWTEGGKRSLVFLNDRQGGFERQTSNLLATTSMRASALIWGDYDNDSSLDAYATLHESSPGWYFHNLGGGAFTTTRADSQWTANGRAVYGAGGVCTDYDQDGLLDLVVAYWGNSATGRWGTNSVLHGVGGGHFEVDVDSPLVLSHIWPETMAFADYDGDGDQDLFIATSGNADQFCLLYRNDGGGAFLQVTNLPMLQTPALSIGQAWGDYDNDGDLDLVLARHSVTDLLWRNLGDGNFEADPAGPKGALGDQPEVPQWGDYDNDGHLDLYLSYASGHSRLFHNRGEGSLEEVFTGSPSRDPLGFGCAWGDYNNDGFLDLVVVGGNAVNYLYRNNLPATGNANHWLKVALRGTVSNRSGIGATIRVKATIDGKEVWQRRDITSQTTEAILIAHFGLGDATQMETLRIEWPSGLVQELEDVAANQFLTITEHEDAHPAAPTLMASPSATGAVRLTLAGQPHCGYVIQGSDDLINWVKVRGCHTLTGVVEHTDPKVAGKSARFYRVLVP